MYKLSKPYKKHLNRREKFDDVADCNYRPSRYVFSYELDNEAVNELEYVKPLEQFKSKGTDIEHIFDFSSVFEFVKDHNYIAEDGYKTIFTYSSPIAKAPDYELSCIDLWHTQHLKSDSNVAHYIFLSLSFVLLIVFFPFLCWFYIKKLPVYKRVVIFRLGKRMKAKGPGWVMLFPICDHYHIITLDDCSAKIKPISGGTQDEALVELSGSVTYHLLDPECVFNTITTSPKQIIETQVQLCLLSNLSHLEWADLGNDSGLFNLATQTKDTLNSRCVQYGICVTNIELDKLKLLRPPTTKANDLSVVSKQIQQISHILINGCGTSDKTNSPISVEQKNENVEDKSLNSFSTTVLPSSDKPNENVSNCPDRKFNNDSKTTFNTHHFLSLSHLLSPQLIAQKRALSSAMSRAQTLLNSDAVCKALDYASLQLIVSETKFTKDELENLDGNENQNYWYFYLDAGTGNASIGKFTPTKTPSATLYVNALDLVDFLSGKLDVLDAIKNEQAFFTGSEQVLSKMRHLLRWPANN